VKTPTGASSRALLCAHASVACIVHCARSIAAAHVHTLCCCIVVATGVQMVDWRTSGSCACATWVQRIAGAL
jgi:hypothetical protein